MAEVAPTISTFCLSILTPSLHHPAPEAGRKARVNESLELPPGREIGAEIRAGHARVLGRVHGPARLRHHLVELVEQFEGGAPAVGKIDRQGRARAGER